MNGVETVVASCFIDGVIWIGSERTCPEQTLKLIRGPRRWVEGRVLACARHGHDGKTLLVPGIPEAPDGEHAYECAEIFRAFLAGELTAAQIKRFDELSVIARSRFDHSISGEG